MHVTMTGPSAKPLDNFLHTVGAPIFGSEEISFHCDNSVEECVRLLRREVGPLTLPRPYPRLVGNASREQVVMYKPAAIISFWPVFRGVFVETNSWVELRGRFGWHWFFRAWLAFWSALFVVLAIALRDVVLLLPALVWITIGAFFWLLGDRDRTEIAQVIQRCLRSPEKADAGRAGETADGV